MVASPLWIGDASTADIDCLVVGSELANRRFSGYTPPSGNFQLNEAADVAVDGTTWNTRTYAKLQHTQQ